MDFSLHQIEKNEGTTVKDFLNFWLTFVLSAAKCYSILQNNNVQQSNSKSQKMPKMLTDVTFLCGFITNWPLRFK